MESKHLIGLEELSVTDIEKIIETGFLFRDILELCWFFKVWK